MRFLRRGSVGALCLVLWFNQAAAAQTAPGKQKIDVLIEFVSANKKRTAPSDPTVPSGGPSDHPSARQVVATAGANGTAAIASSPSFPTLAGLAFDKGLAAVSSGAFTFDLSLFGLRALADPAVVYDQTKYRRRSNGLLRSIAGELSVGGKGEKFDRDGDGVADEPLQAQRWSDIATGEVRLRVLGSRDRRGQRNVDGFVREVGAKHQAFIDAANHFMVAHDAEIMNLDIDAFRAFLTNANLPVRQDLDKLDALLAEYESTNTDAVASIDRQSVWTLVLGGTRRADEFGPDRAHIGLRTVSTTSAWDHTFNLEWQRATSFMGHPSSDAFKVAYELSTLLFKGKLSAAGSKLSFAVSGEKNRNVPDAKHRSIFKASSSLALPISPTLSVPITLTYANHADLLTAGHTWAGQVSLAWDLSNLEKKKQ